MLDTGHETRIFDRTDIGVMAGFVDAARGAGLQNLASPARWSRRTFRACCCSVPTFCGSIALRFAPVWSMRCAA